MVVPEKNPGFGYFGVLELALVLRKQASALRKHLRGANVHLAYYGGGEQGEDEHD